MFVYTTVSGKLATFKHLEVIANNLANMNTVGFRSERILFEKALTRESARVTAGAFDSDIQKPTGLKTDEFVGIRGSFTDFSQGAIEMSGNPLDVAIQGKGFFVVSAPEGDRYTRAGNFRLDESNRLTTQDGFPVLGSGGTITVNGGNVQITNEGEIMVDGKSQGKLRVVEIEAKNLERTSAMLFSLKSGGQVTEASAVRVQSGAIEGSNVNAVRELSDMIMASRIFDSFAKAEEANSRMTDLRNQKIGTSQG